MRALLAALLLSSLLAGCSGAAGSDGPALASAADWEAAARGAASAWAEDAYLVGIESGELDDAARAELAAELEEARQELEQARAEGEEDGSGADLATLERLLAMAQRVADTPDPDIGDGLASVWTYTYAARSELGDAFFVAVARGEVLFAQSESDLGGFGGDDSSAAAVGEWSVDSDDAASAAALGDADYARLRGAPQTASYASLSAGADGPVWSLGIESDSDEGESASLAVDANDGSIVRDAAVAQPVIDVVEQEVGESQGSFIAAVAAAQTLRFDVLDGRHLELAIEAAMFPPPAQPITATLTDPLGAQTVLTLQLGADPRRVEDNAVLSVVPNGTYELRFDVPLSPFATWRMSWCTDGTPVDYEDAFEVQACQLLAQSGGSGGETLSRSFRWAGAWLR